MDCVFCSIVKHQIPAQRVYEDEYVLAFRDINPQAKVHIIVIPKEHKLSTINDFNIVKHGNLFSHIFDAIHNIVVQEGLEKEGYRIVNNCGKNGAQTVMHLHFHILGGEQLSDRMN